MLFFAREWSGPSWFESERAAASLALFAGGSASSYRLGSDFFAEVALPRGVVRRGWRVPRSPSGWQVLFSGWLDNATDLANELSVDPRNLEQLYGAAVERWGDEADRYLIGTYAAIISLPDGTVRMSRSPWASKPLFYYSDSDVLIASSVVRPLFAGGVTCKLRQEAIDCLLAMESPEIDKSQFCGIDQVPHGAVVHIDRYSRRCVYWYDPVSVPMIKYRKDQDYVDAANGLLTEAVRKAVGVDGKFGMTLSGGLDSATVCDEVLRQIPSGHRLTSFTFEPLSDWDGRVQSHKFGNDRPWVEAFAKLHPSLDPVFVDNAGLGYDDRMDRVFLAAGSGLPSRMLGTVHHAVYDAAREHRCDWLLYAHFGNLTFSTDAPWSYCEFLRRGRFLQLWKLAAARINDTRSVWRRIGSHAVMPQLPADWRRIIRNAMHQNNEGSMFANPFLRMDSRLSNLRHAENLSASIMPIDQDVSRAAHIRREYQSMGLGSELLEGDEQVFGVRLRDVTAYRPLIEFCFGIPTDQFVRDGETRWLARRMGVGRLPEAQRTNRLYGEHNVDWHARMTPRLADLRRQVEAISDHPQIGPLIDVDAMIRTLDQWPDQTPDDQDLAGRLRFFIPAVLHVTRYVDFMTGRNG